MTSWRYKVYMMLIMDFHLCCLHFTHLKNRGSRPLVFCNLHLATMRIAVFTASDICSLFNALVSTYKVPFDWASSQASLLDTKLAFFSFLRSILLPIKRKGVNGLCDFISWIHDSFMFSKDARSEMSKHNKKISVSLKVSDRKRFSRPPSRSQKLTA